MKKMTPILYCKPSEEGKAVSVLWLGGQNAANDLALLRQNDITARICLKGVWGCKKCGDIEDLQPFMIHDVIGWGDNLSEDAFRACKAPFKAVERILSGQSRSILVFCKQGARRAASFAAMFLMAKCRLRGDAAYNHVKGCRAIVEDNVRNVAEYFERIFDLWQHWTPMDSVAECPIVARPEQLVVVFVLFSSLR